MADMRPPRDLPDVPGVPGAPGVRPRSRFGRSVKTVLLLLLLAWLSLAFWNFARPRPPGTHVVSLWTRLADSDIDFLYESPQHSGILASESSIIDRAEELIVLDRSPIAPGLCQHLLARKRARPNLKIVLITDLGDETFGAARSQYLESLERAGIIVVRWSHMLSSNPDQRQLIVADDGSGGWASLVDSGSSQNLGGRAALMVRGRLAQDIVASELQIAAWSTDDDRLPAAPQMYGRGVGSVDARFLTEGAIGGALLDAIAAAGGGDRIYIAACTLSDRRLIAALLRAAARGAEAQILLDPNRTPNPAAAGELLRDGGGHVAVRWNPIGGPIRTSLLIVRHRADLWMNLGSADFTRRNRSDLNLAAGVELRMPARAAPARAAADYFANAWSNAAGYAEYADESALAYWRYRLVEATGLSSYY